MNELQIFENPAFGQVRTWTESDGSISFCAPDATRALGYKDSVNAIKTHCKKDGVAFHHLTDNLGRQQETKFISQGNLLRLAANSKLPGADKFERWIFDEVIPSVLKHGMYAMDELLENPDIAIQAFTALKEERAKRKALEDENAQQKQMLAEYSPKASYYDVVLQTKDLIAIGTIAKDYGKTAIWLNKYLHDKGVQFKQGKLWMLYQKYAGCGYTQTQTGVYGGSKGEQHSKLHTYWTQKGRLFIYDLLKRDGILPLMEREQNNAS